MDTENIINAVFDYVDNEIEMTLKYKNKTIIINPWIFKSCELRDYIIEGKIDIEQFKPDGKHLLCEDEIGQIWEYWIGDYFYYSNENDYLADVQTLTNLGLVQ